MELALLLLEIGPHPRTQSTAGCQNSISSRRIQRAVFSRVWNFVPELMEMNQFRNGLLSWKLSVLETNEQRGDGNDQEADSPSPKELRSLQGNQEAQSEAPATSTVPDSNGLDVKPKNASLTVNCPKCALFDGSAKERRPKHQAI